MNSRQSTVVVHPRVEHVPDIVEGAAEALRSHRRGNRGTSRQSDGSRAVSPAAGLKLATYVGIPADHPSSFRYWIRHHFVNRVHPRSISYIEGDAPDLSLMLQEYSRQLLAGPMDLAFVGIGENGHIAFNDPDVADFADPEVVKRVALDEVCRRQQVGEGHFPDLESVPKEAVTVTCPGLFRARRWICCVPDRRKAEAVKGSLLQPGDTAVPRHAGARAFVSRALSGYGVSVTFAARFCADELPGARSPYVREQENENEERERLKSDHRPASLSCFPPEWSCLVDQVMNLHTAAAATEGLSDLVVLVLLIVPRSLREKEND